LKQIARPPGIAFDDMKTISEQVTVRRSFKQAQLLPVLTADMISDRGGVTALPMVWRRTEMPSSQRRRPRVVISQLPRPAAMESSLERILFALLALSAAAAAGYALIMTIKLSPNWPMFNAWVTRLLG
jgi:hypothetical protein